MAFTTLIADNFQGSGNLGLATNGVPGVGWSSLDTAGNTNVFQRGALGGMLNLTAALNSGRSYEVYSSSVTATLPASGLTFEAGIYGTFSRFEFDTTNITGESAPFGTLIVGLATNGNVYVDTWGATGGGVVWSSPVANIGAITSSTLTVVQVFRSANTFTVSFNGTQVFAFTPYIDDLAWAAPLPTLTLGSVVSVSVRLWFADKSSNPSHGPVGGPTAGGLTIKYIHVASGTPTGTYLGAPPSLIFAASAAEASASATLISPPRPPDATRSYPFQNFVAWNELSSHTVTLRDVRPHKLSRTVTAIRSAAAVSGDSSTLAVYVVGQGDRWVSGGLLHNTPAGWVHVDTLPERLFAAGSPLHVALDGTGRRMMCATASGWELYRCNPPATNFENEQGAALPGGAVACALDSRGVTAVVLTATQAIIYTSDSPLDLLRRSSALSLPSLDTWACVSLSGDGSQVLITGATHSMVYTRTGDVWDAAGTPDFAAVFGAINTDGTLATAVSGETLVTTGLQNARLSLTAVAPGPASANNVALTSTISGASQASESFVLVLPYNQALPANYSLCNGAAVLAETAVVRTFISDGSPRFKPSAQREQFPQRSGYWVGLADETP